jgi:hypothetical protein
MFEESAGASASCSLTDRKIIIVILFHLYPDRSEIMSSSRMFSTRDLILPVIIVICSLTLAQEPGSNLDYPEGGEDGENIPEQPEEAHVPLVEETTVMSRPYPAERSNVYPYVKEKAPPFHFAVWDETGKICILAKLDASFTITYNTKYGKQQMIDRVDSDATIDGRCESFLDEKPVMDMKWRGGFTFRMIFDKVMQITA